MKSIQFNYPGYDDATLTGYLLDCAIPLGQEEKRPAVIVCPGGGYIYCSDAEGEPVALRYAASGYGIWWIMRCATATGPIPTAEITGNGRMMETSAPMEFSIRTGRLPPARKSLNLYIDLFASPM